MWSWTRAASAGCRTRTSTARTTPRMRDSSATRPARVGLGAKIFVAATLSIAAVLGVTLGLTTVQADRTAGQSIRRALAGGRRGVPAVLAGRGAAVVGTSGGGGAGAPVRRGGVQRGGRPQRVH